MVDAWTQTERSDFAIIKLKMQKKLEQKAHLELNSHLPGTYDKKKMNGLLTSHMQHGGSRSALRADNASTPKTIIEPKSNNSDLQTKAYTQIGKNSQLTLGFSKSARKVPAKRSIMKMGKRKQDEKMRLPSIQASRDTNIK